MSPLRQISGSAQDRILTTAAGLFAQFGYNGISTRDIACHADVNEVTIYRRYRRKRDLYCAVLQAELGKIHLRGDLLAGMAEAQDGRTALQRTFELITVTLENAPDLLRLVQLSSLELYEDVDALLRKHLGELIEVIAGYLRPFVANGQLQCRDARSLVLAMALLVFGQQSIGRMFSGDFAKPQDILSAYAEVCAPTES